MTGSAVVGPLTVERAPAWRAGDPESWTFTYPNGHTAFAFKVSEPSDASWVTSAT